MVLVAGCQRSVGSRAYLLDKFLGYHCYGVEEEFQWDVCVVFYPCTTGQKNTPIESVHILGVPMRRMLCWVVFAIFGGILEMKDKNILWSSTKLRSYCLKSMLESGFIIWHPDFCVCMPSRHGSRAALSIAFDDKRWAAFEMSFWNPVFCFYTVPHFVYHFGLTCCCFGEASWRLIYNG